MIYLDLFLGFLKVGCFSFGGAYSAIPLIRDTVHSYGWLDDAFFSYMIGVSESTPGPIMVNLATYVGSSQAGILGAAIATFAVVLPSFIMILLVCAILQKVIQNPYVQALLRGLKPSIVGIILATGLYMIVRNIFLTSFGFDGKALGMTAVLSLLYWGARIKTKKGMSPIFLIIAAALLGIAVSA